MSKIFFYGLFMDRSLLTGKGLHPEMIGPAVLPGYRIHIGERATLLPSASSRAYGNVMKLEEQEAQTLYSEPSVREYVKENVQVELLDSGEALEAHCYNLPRELGLAGANPKYAIELSKLVDALQFDAEYVEDIAKFADEGPMTYFEVTSPPIEPKAIVAALIEKGAPAVLLSQAAMTDDFFHLQTGVAGELLHELAKYRLRLAGVVPDPSALPKPFQEFLEEANRGTQARFFTERDEAITWLDST